MSGESSASPPNDFHLLALSRMRRLSETLDVARRSTLLDTTEADGPSLSDETRDAFEQAEAMLADAEHERFATLDELLDDLGL